MVLAFLIEGILGLIYEGMGKGPIPESSRNLLTPAIKVRTERIVGAKEPIRNDKLNLITCLSIESFIFAAQKYKGLQKYVIVQSKGKRMVLSPQEKAIPPEKKQNIYYEKITTSSVAGLQHHSGRSGGSHGSFSRQCGQIQRHCFQFLRR